MNAAHMRTRWLVGVTAVWLLLTTAGGAQAQTERGTLRFLAVGVSQYQLADANLKFADKDAQDLAAFWRSQEGRLVARVEGETLVNAQATLANIEAALDRLIAQVRPGDRVAISLSGHGAPGTEWAFLPNDFDPARRSDNRLTAGALRAKVAQLTARGALVLLVIDACHSGAVGNFGDGVVAFVSCQPEQYSFEDPGQRNGLFTKALIEALQGQADINHDGIVSLAEVDAYVTARVQELTRQMEAGGARLRSEQHPGCGHPANIRGGLVLAVAGHGRHATHHTASTATPHGERAR
jgi:uncharacterized caspase-like protein